MPPKKSRGDNKENAKPEFNSSDQKKRNHDKVTKDTKEEKKSAAKPTKRRKTENGPEAHNEYNLTEEQKQGLTKFNKLDPEVQKRTCSLCLWQWKIEDLERVARVDCCDHIYCDCCITDFVKKDPMHSVCLLCKKEIREIKYKDEEDG